MGVAANTTGRQNLFIPEASSHRVWVESPLLRTELDIYWVVNLAWSNRPKGYNIYRSQSPTFVMGSPSVTQLNSSLLRVPLFRDTTVDLTRRTIYWYLVTEVLEDNTERPLDIPTALGNPFTTAAAQIPSASPQMIYREFRRRKHLIQRRTAEKVDLLIERTAGTRCSCYSPAFESGGSDACNACYGTSFQGGYEVLIDVEMRILTPNEMLRVQPAGLQFVSTDTGWIVDFPLMRNGDVVVRRNGRRYEVDSVQSTRHQGIITEQDFDLKELETTAPVYAFNIPPASSI